MAPGMSTVLFRGSSLGKLSIVIFYMGYSPAQLPRSANAHFADEEAKAEGS